MMAWWRSLLQGARSLKDRAARNAEIDEELESYIGESISDKMQRGMSLRDARQAAHAEVGSALAVRDRVWKASWESRAELAWKDLLYTLRRLGRHPGLVLVVLLSIGVGVGANATVFSLVSKFLLQGPPVGDPARLIALGRTHERGPCCDSFPLPVVQDLQRSTQSFTGVAGYFELVPAAMGGGDEPDRLWGQAVTTNFFDVAQMKMAAGRGFAVVEDRTPVIVLGYRLWQQKFGGDPGVVGRTLDLSGHSYTVIGVAASGFRGLDQVLDPQFWVPLGDLGQLMAGAPSRESRSSQWLRVIARLKPGVTSTMAARELEVVSTALARQYPATDRDTGVVLDKVGSLGRFESPLKMFLLALSVVAWMVLLIACANVANLLLAHGAERQREMAVRLSLGATRGQLLRQLLLESLLLALGGGVVGVLLSRWATRALSSFQLPAPIPMDLSVAVSWHTLVYAFVLSLVAGVVCGFVPAWTASRPAILSALKGETPGQKAGRRWNLRNILVITQVTLSLILLCGAGLFLRSLRSAAKIDVGFRSRGLVMMAIDPQLHRYTAERTLVLLRTIRERMAAVPGVLHATVTDGVPLSLGHRSDGFEVAGRPAPQGNNSVDLYMAGPDYFEAMGIPRLAGRAIGDENPTASRIGVVNEEFVRRYFQGDSPIGHITTGAGVSYTIVGVVANTKSRTIGEDQRPVLYRSIDQSLEKDPSGTGYSFMVRYEGDSQIVTRELEQVIHAVDPSLAIFNVATMEEHLHEALFLPRFVGTLFTVFGLAGVLLASIGLYGVMSYMVSRRTKEIGVRIALGARAGQVQGMVVGDGLRLTLVSLLLGVPLALATSRLTGSLLYNVRPWDAPTFLLVPALLTAVCLTACWVPSRRASRVDPMEALREE